jgi:putative endonuclease
MCEFQAVVYMVRCADGTLYTGWTNDLEKRIAAHNAGRGGRYTRIRRPVELVYWEGVSGRAEALKRELQIKQLSRAKKDELVRQSRLGGSSQA